LEALVEPDNALAQELENRVAQVDQALQRGRETFETLHAECAELQEASAKAVDAVSLAQREHAAAEAQLATLRQIQAEAESNAPLREWIERLGLGGTEPLFHKLRIDSGWETAVEAVLCERLHALPSGSLATSARPPTKAALFEAGHAQAEAATGRTPLAAKVHAVDGSIAGALA